MSWNEPPPAEARAENMLLPALASLGLAFFALCLPPAALVSVGLAWWCWWKCGQDAAVRGFGWTLAALVVGHVVLLFWMTVIATVLDDARGMTIALVVALVYVVICTAATRSAPWKYAIATVCLSAVAGSLTWNAISAAREDARSNAVRNNLRQLGVEQHQLQGRHSGPPENQSDFGWLNSILSDAENWQSTSSQSDESHHETFERDVLTPDGS